MKIVNIMNFVRQFDPRVENSAALMYDTTKRELELVNEYRLENTFLLQYDALIDSSYVQLFKEKAGEKTELGLWLEIVQPLCEKAGIEWTGRQAWDWHVVPGFSMAYTKPQRKKMLDIAMQDFKNIYGYYPKTVASWLLDSYTVEYLSAQYSIEAFAICRDQTNTDNYTLIGGYFNQGYFPSRLNCFTPAQTGEMAVETPVFRLLGPDPIHNYDNDKHIISDNPAHRMKVYTLEPTWQGGANAAYVEWMFDTYFKNESLGFAYAQIGQENSFCYPRVCEALRMQLDMLLKNYPDVCFEKMCTTGKRFKEKFGKKTPATCVWASKDWVDGDCVQSLYYNCRNYSANLFRFKNKIFIRSMYLFDEKVQELYLENPCTTWDAIYENLPVVDTLQWKNSIGLQLDEDGAGIQVKRPEEAVILAQWKDKEVIFTEDGISLRNFAGLTLDVTDASADIKALGSEIQYTYKGIQYALLTNCAVSGEENVYRLSAQEDEIKLTVRRVH